MINEVKIVSPTIDIININKLIKDRINGYTKPIQTKFMKRFCNSAIVMEHVGRVCYNSYDAITENSIASFLSSAAKKGHRTVFEFSNLMFSIKLDINRIINLFNQLNQYNKFMVIEYYQIDSDTGILILKGSLRAYIELIEMYINNNNTNQIDIDFFYNLYSRIYNEFDYIIDSWESMKSIDYFYNSVDKLYNSLHLSSLIDIISDYYNNSNNTKILTYITCGRDSSHEIVRHRQSSPLQASQRYIRFNKDNPYSICLGQYQQGTIKQTVIDSVLPLFQKYTEMINNKIKPENARVILPNCTTTNLFLYADKIEYRHIFKLRQSKYAYPPVKEIFDSLYQQMIDMNIL